MNKKLSWVILGAFILGILSGLFIPQVILSISVLGDLYVNLLKIMIVPILFFGIISALSSSNAKQMSNITGKTILLFIGMFIASFVINYGLVTLIQPGVGFYFTQVEWTGELPNINFSNFLLSLVPSNLITAASNNQILPVIISAFILGIALHKENSLVLNSWFKSMNNLCNRILQWIMYLTPIGVFSLIGNTVAQYGGAVIISALTYIGMAWLGCLVVMLLVMILPVWIYCHISPIQYIKKVIEIWIITLSTCSSAATLPETIRVCNTKFNVPAEITNIVVPLGCTIHMCGGAVSFSLLALFTAQMYGISFTIPMFIVALGMALLINMGAPGIPGGGIVIGATYLTMLGLPIAFIGFYAGIYRLLDMAYTTMNVTGDITANCIIKESLK